MAGLQGQLQQFQRENDENTSMNAFLVKQAIDNRGTDIGTLSGLQQDMARSLADQIAKI
jgi:hypothetical protein